MSVSASQHGEEASGQREGRKHEPSCSHWLRFGWGGLQYLTLPPNYVESGFA